MKASGSTRDSSLREGLMLLAGAAGLAEGLRAVATTPGTFTGELVVIVSVVLLPVWLAALLVAPVVKILRWALGGPRNAPAAGPEEPLSTSLALGTCAGVLAALVGHALVNTASTLMPREPALVSALVAFLATGVVLAFALRAIRRAAVPRTMTIAASTLGLLLMGLAIHGIARAAGLPPEINSGNGRPVAEAQSWAGDDPPNILLIVLDTTRLDRLSLYGYPFATSPNLDQFAKEALVYERAISAAPWTLPSHASMFTGLWPRVHQATEEHRMLGEEFTTLAEILLQHGYETVGFSSNSVVGRSHNLQQGFQSFYEVCGDFLHSPVNPFQELLPVQVIDRFVHNVGWRDKGAERATTLAEHWLDQWQRRSNRRPFFAFVNYLEGHLPYRPPSRLHSSFGVGLPSPEIRPLVTFDFRHGDIYRLIGFSSLLDAEDYRQLGATYDASLAYQDEWLGRLIDGVRDRGLLGDTVVIVVSDHGENLGDHGGLLGHAFSVHQTLIHVPLVIRYPTVFPPGQRHQGVVSTTSLFRTILDLADAEPDSSWPPNVGPLPTSDAGDHVPAITEYAVPVWELYNLAVEARGVDIGPMIVRTQAIQNDKWKLIRKSDGSVELFDLENDPVEMKPLDPTASEEGRVLLEQMKAELDGLVTPQLSSIDSPSALDAVSREALRALGYIQ